MSAVSFPVRPASNYKPKIPADSFLRTGYQKTSTNPKGYHWGVDIPCPVDSIIQLPERAQLIDKGWGGDTGYWMEWKFLEGPWKGRYGRFFHMNRACAFSVGTIKNRRYAVCRSGNTGNSTGPHVHFELGKTRWDVCRDPRWNAREAFKDAVVDKDY